MFVQVYRDDQGVPHIVAESERSAWYALGYEQARDGLLWIQYACRAARGELTWVRADATGLLNDCAVKILGVHLGGRSEAQLRTMFSDEFYDNLVAYTDGVNAYRLAVATAPATTPLTPERELRNWLDSNSLLPIRNLSWVYNDPVQLADIASQGGLVDAFWSFFRAEMPVVNSVGDSYTFTGNGPIEQSVDPDRAVDPLDPRVTERLFAELRQHASALPGAASGMCGSNSFAWSRLYCQDASTNPPISYAGLLADPHQAVPFHGPNFLDQFKGAPNHMWFAHVQVMPAGATQPTYDTFGHVPYASATFQSFHNRSVAVGGTAGAPNWTDHFVLRLEEGAGGTPSLPHRFYSYYHDNPAAPSNATYQPITEHPIAILRPDNNLVTIHYWTAQSFGIILPNLVDAGNYIAAWLPQQGQTGIPGMPVVYGERVDVTAANPPRWRVSLADPQPRMRYWSQPETWSSGPLQGQLRTSPMVVTLRIPMHDKVAGNSATPAEMLHWQLLRDFWQITHASSILDVVPHTNGGAYPVNLCCVDRDGNTLSTQLTRVPQRGDDAALQAAGYTSIDKVLFYGGLMGPVPARHMKDKMFDWKFGTSGSPNRPAPLQYLDYPGIPPVLPATNVPPFKPLTMQWQLANVAFPPTGPIPNPALTGSLFFTSACNDQIWGYTRKRDGIGLVQVPVGQPRPWVDVTTGSNWLLEKVLQGGCAYQSQVLATEAPDRQQIVVDQFKRQADRIVNGAANGQPPLTPAQMREFVVTPRLHVEPEYVSPTGSTAYAAMPVAVRQVAEVLGNPSFRSPTEWPRIASPLERANEELWFFRDLWSELNNPQSPWNAYQVQPGVQVSLLNLWVNVNDPTHPEQVFWYDDPTASPPGPVRWINIPAAVPLIDFLWSGSDLGSGFTTGAAAGTSTPNALSASELGILSGLVNSVWGPNNWNYHNEPSSAGACLLGMFEMGYRATGATYGRHWVRWRGGPQSGQVPEHEKWEGLRSLAFPGSQLGTLLGGGLNPPYDALYSNPASHQVRTSPRAEDINELVKFFLELGGHYIAPADNDGNPSRKAARWELANHDPDIFRLFLPDSYPLTGGLERATVLRRLLDANAFLAGISATTPPMGQVFRARAYDQNGQKLWPAAADAPCVGAGLRAVGWHEEPYGSQGATRFQGFQTKFLGMSGSYATLMAMFPSQGDVESYFWCTPGVQAMGNDLRGAQHTAQRFHVHMDAFSNNALMRSHFSDFLVNQVSVLAHTYWL